MKALPALAIFMTLLLGSPGWASSANAQSWSLLFKHGTSKTRATLTRDKVCFDNGVYKYLIVPPNYEHMRIISDDSKMYFDCSVKDFKKTWSGLGYPYQWQIKRVGTDVIVGLACQHYRAVAVNAPGAYADFWSNRTIPAQPHLAEICCSLCDVPTGYGLPVRMTLHAAGAGIRQQVILDALKVEPQPKAIDAAVFTTPRSYGRAKTMIDVVTGSKDGVLNFEDFFSAAVPGKGKAEPKGQR